MPNQISGTWDFKWPQRKTIRFAFQALPTDDAAIMPSLDYLIDKYIGICEKWLARRPSIYFDFSLRTTPLPAPVKANGIQDARSPDAVPRVEYDVLVSFASTPLRVLDPNPTYVTTVTGQLSVLGSYARRINYGTPTTLVGPNRENIPASKALGDYFDDPIFTHIVLHEVGHVLGIPHQHQNPLYRNRPDVIDNYSIDAKLQGVRKKFWTQFDAEFDEEIRKLWPSLPENNGTIPFSDWSVYNGTSSERLENVTVMAHPIWSDLLVGTFPGTSVVHQAPQPYDLDLLSKMYPPV